jgi:hypothetical protein
MLLTRWIKNRNFMNDNIRKYLGYAAGEIVLVIVGVLIALQIDAWYDAKQIRPDLQEPLLGEVLLAHIETSNAVAGFLMFEDACSFSIREVTYLDPGEA